jgi:outer membrane biogenesis lipoprotein LolB
MRASLSVYTAIAVTVLALLVLSDCANTASSRRNTRNEPMKTFRFQEMPLSTARGFGKRDGSVVYTAGNGNTAAERMADR